MKNNTIPTKEQIVAVARWIHGKQNSQLGTAEFSGNFDKLPVGSRRRIQGLAKQLLTDPPKELVQHLVAAYLADRAVAVKVTQEPLESEYWRAVRTGNLPRIWPPISMTRDELKHFRASRGNG